MADKVPPRVTDGLLNELEEKALACSEFDRKNGDRWRCNHNYVVNDKHTVMCPAVDAIKGTVLWGYPASPYRYSRMVPERFIARASPETVVALVREIRRLRSARDEIGGSDG